MNGQGGYQLDTSRRHTPAEARRKLAAIQRVLLLLAVVYLGAHAWVVYHAFNSTGVVAALATLLTLGFGDLYWAIYASEPATSQLALLAALMAFASWLSRPWSTRYLLQLGIDAVDWPSHDNEQAGKDNDGCDDAADVDSRTGAAAVPGGPTGAY